MTTHRTNVKIIFIADRAAFASKSPSNCYAQLIRLRRAQQDVGRWVHESRHRSSCGRAVCRWIEGGLEQIPRSGSSRMYPLEGPTKVDLHVHQITQSETSFRKTKRTLSREFDPRRQQTISNRDFANRFFSDTHRSDPAHQLDAFELLTFQQRSLLYILESCTESSIPILRVAPTFCVRFPCGSFSSFLQSPHQSLC